MKKPSVAVGDVPLAGPFLAQGVLSEAPELLEHLTATKWDDGSPRQTSTLLLFVEGGRLKGCLSDRACARTLWSSGPSMESLVQSFEVMLADGSAEWRAAGGGGKSRR